MGLKIISRVIGYYFSMPEFEGEILRAYNEFFGSRCESIEQIKFRDEIEEGLFKEWFLYDFKLSNNLSPLEFFYLTNPLKLSEDSLQECKDLKENSYGFYKVLEVSQGYGLVVENLQTGKVYEVKEFLATFYLSKGHVIPTRVGKVGDHYELVGSASPLPLIKLSPILEKKFRKLKIQWSPKVIWEMYLSGVYEREEPQTLTLEEAENNLKIVLSKYGLDRFVTSELLKEWIYNKSETDLYFLNILSSLLYPVDNYADAMDELTIAFNNFYNRCPQKALGGKSPMEKVLEHKERGIPPDFRLTLKKSPIPDLYKKYSKSLEFAKKGDAERALKKINELFSYMLKNKITSRDIYRMFANKGAFHGALGDWEKCTFFLQIALELNPYYDFAKTQLKKLKKMGYSFEKIEKTKFQKDIAYKYYIFLKSLKINFAQREDG